MFFVIVLEMPRLRAGWFLFPLIVPVLFSVLDLRLNRSGSLPLGLYREDRSLPIAYGAYVSACLPEGLAGFGRGRGYLPVGEDCPAGVLPILKRVVALPGDQVLLREGGLEVEGVPIARTARRAEDRRHRPIPRLSEGSYRVPPGAVWVVGNARPESWDSRYYGPLPLKSLRPARPVFVF
jgi:conjugative transfer signal peptidase TraF